MDWRHLRVLLSVGEVVFDRFINLCVWSKTNGGMGSLYRSQHEMILIFKKGNALHINNVKLGKDGRYRTNVWTYPGVNTFSKGRAEVLSMHPTVKPTPLVADAILDVTTPGQIVLDGFIGSGTTLLAAEKTSRRCYGVEIEPGYVDVALRRWEMNEQFDNFKHIAILSFDLILDSLLFSCGVSNSHRTRLLPSSATPRITSTGTLTTRRAIRTFRCRPSRKTMG